MLTQSDLKSWPKSHDSGQLQADVLDKHTKIILTPALSGQQFPPPEIMIIFFIVIKEKQLVWFLISRYVYKLRGNVLMEP